MWGESPGIPVLFKGQYSVWFSGEYLPAQWNAQQEAGQSAEAETHLGVSITDHFEEEQFLKL